MIKKAILKKAVMLSLAAALVATPVVASAARGVQGVDYGPYGSTSDNNTTEPSGGSENSGSSSKGGGSGSSSGGGAVSVAVTSEVKLSTGETLTSSVPVYGTVKSVPGVIVSAPKDVVNSAFKLEEGQTAKISINDSNYGPAAQQSIKDAAAALGTEVGPVLDITGGIVAKNGKLTSVGKLEKLVNFTVAVPAGFLKAGYELAVIRVEAGGAVSVLPNWSQDPSKLSFYTDAFGVFALTQVPAGTIDNVKVAQYNQSAAQ